MGVLIEIAYVILSIALTLYFNWRIRRFLKGFCPKGTMSCIKKYRRNILSLNDCFKLLLSSKLLISFEMGCTSQTLTKRLPTQTLFWVYNFVSTTFFIINVLMLRQLVSVSKRPFSSNIVCAIKEFYVTLPPAELEPRRDTMHQVPLLNPKSKYKPATEHNTLKILNLNFKSKSKLGVQAQASCSLTPVEC